MSVHDYCERIDESMHSILDDLTKKEILTLLGDYMTKQMLVDELGEWVYDDPEGANLLAELISHRNKEQVV